MSGIYSLKNKLDKIEAHVLPPTEEAEAEQKRLNEILLLLKEISDLEKQIAIDNESLTPQQRADKKLALAEELSLHRCDNQCVKCYKA